MTIIYTVICRARDSAILTEVADSDYKGGNISQVLVQMFQYFRDHPDEIKDGDRKTFVQQNKTEMDFISHFLDACSSAMGEEEYQEELYYIHLYMKDGFFYCCLADDPDARDQKVSFAFLEGLQKDFTKKYRVGRRKTARAYALDKDFAPTIRANVHYHNVHQKELREDEAIRKINAKLENMKNVMGRNLQLLIQRGEKFDALLDKTTEVEGQTEIFKKRARPVKRIQQRVYYSKAFFVCLLIVLLVYIGVAIPCGFTMKRCSVSYNPDGGTSNPDGGTRFLRG